MPIVSPHDETSDISFPTGFQNTQKISEISSPNMMMQSTPYRNH